MTATRGSRSWTGLWMVLALAFASVPAVAGLLFPGAENGVGEGPESIAIADQYGDGDADLVVANQKLWGNFCELIGKQEWIDDPRFASNPKRVENRALLFPVVAEGLVTKTCADWVELFVAASIPCGPVNNMQSRFVDPQVLHRDMRAELPHPPIGTLQLAGIPSKRSATPPAMRLPPPLPGEHTDEILADVRAYPPRKTEALRQQGVIQK